MFPIGDDRVEGGPPPLVTVGLVALNVLAFLYELNQPTEGALQSFIQAWGVVPREYTAVRDLPPTIPLPFWTTLITSMFLHGGWMHLGGNMLYLWIFGDNLEKVMGPVKFLLFYLACGIAAGLAHIAFSGASNVPTVGASGAISGVLGGYLVLFPRARVLTLFVLLLFFVQVVEVPAALYLAFWFLMQLVSGTASLALAEDGSGGVAWWAHVGGFVVGMALAPLIRRRGPPQLWHDEYATR